MVSSQVLFNRIIAADTLLLLNGIVPSISDYQKKLIDTLEQFSKAMKYERISENEAHDIFRILCYYIDKHTDTCMRKNSLSWKKYSLENYFSSVQHEEECVANSLKQLLKSKNKLAKTYALRILTLLSCLPYIPPGLSDLQSKYSPEPPPRQPEPAYQAREKMETSVSQSQSNRFYVWGEIVIYGVLVTSLWFCCFHYLEDLYQCLF